MIITIRKDVKKVRSVRRLKDAETITSLSYTKSALRITCVLDCLNKKIHKVQAGHDTQGHELHDI